MLDDWKRWCRLCAKQNYENKVIYQSDVENLVKKYFGISLGAASCICDECMQFIISVETFHEKVRRCNQMYNELNSYQMITTNLQEIREKYFGGSSLLSEVKTEVNLITIPPEHSKLKTRQSSRKKNEPVTNVEKPKTEVTLITTPPQLKTVPTVKIEVNAFSGNTNFDHDQGVDGNSEACSGGEEVIQDEIIPTIQKTEPINAVNVDLGKSSDKRYFCDQCDKSYSRRQSLKEHMKLKHLQHPEESYPFKCDLCPKKFLLQKTLISHKSVHLPPEKKVYYSCPYCDKKLTKIKTVQSHIKNIHIGERPFVCEECGKSFQTKGALKDHQIIHSSQFPFQCAICLKRFKNLARLKAHEDIHTNTSYVCPHCGLQLNTKRTLKMHMVVHSDEKKYKCQYCGNGFKRSKALKSHLILHTGLRPYSCPFCDKTFANGSNCRSHKKKAHPQELAELEATGDKQKTIMPRLDSLQPKNILKSAEVTTMSTEETVQLQLDEGKIISEPNIMEQATIVTQIQQNQRTITVQAPILEHANTIGLHTGTVIHQVVPQIQPQHLQLPTMTIPVTMLSLVQTTQEKQ